MDNNTNNNNVSGFTNVSDIKFEDTPAVSFENLYGGLDQQPSVNVVNNQGPSMTPNPAMGPGVNSGPSVAPSPGMNPGVNPGPNVAPNPGMNPNVNLGPNVAPNPGMNPGVNPGPSVTPNSGMNPGVNPEPSVTPNPGMNPGVNPGPSVTPNPGMNPNVNPEPSVTPNPGMNPNVNPGPNVAPNPGTIIQPPVEDLSNMDIDAEKMQSIEEQLSKTSQYNPADFQQEKITISTDDEYEKNKSGLSFVIVLFVILALVIAFLPQITKLIK